MNQIFKCSLSLALLFVTSVAMAAIPYLDPRSQGINGARELVGWQTQINKWDMCSMYGSFSITPEYTQTFWDNRITEALFSEALVNNNTTSLSTTNNCLDNCHNNCNDNCCGNTILIQGTKVANRNAQALMAENFYLPSDYSSVVKIHPKVQNFLVDFNYYQGLDEWVEGMYFRIHTPVTWTRWNLNYCEDNIVSGTMPMDPGYFNNSYTTTAVSAFDTDVYGLSRSDLLANFEQFISGKNTITGVEGTTFDKLEGARWNNCRMSKTALAEITAALGWNFVRRENFLFGLNIRAAAPTGNRPHGKYIFEPIVGNGKHWELGGGLNSWWTWWKSCDEDRNLTVYLDAYATHMFKTRQCRTFDLVGKPLSRYMLAEKFDTTVTDLTASNTSAITSVAPTAQFANEFTPVANLTTIPVDVSYAVQGEVILKFAYTHCNFQFDLGYDFWGRSCAKIQKRCDCCNNGFQDNVWGLKGDAFVYGFPSNGTTYVTNAGIPLSATESAATIFAGTNSYPQTTTEVWAQNPGIDNPELAWNGNVIGSTGLYTHQIGDDLAGTSVWRQVNTSVPPVLLTSDDIDTCSAQLKGISNKIFTHVGYTWKDCECWTPYLGIGGEVEFGSHGKCGNDNSCHTPCVTSSTTAATHSTVTNNCLSSCHDNSNNCHNDCNNGCGHNGNENCKKFAFSQWGVWVKGGFSFN